MIFYKIGGGVLFSGHKATVFPNRKYLKQTFEFVFTM